MNPTAITGNNAIEPTFRALKMDDALTVIDHTIGSYVVNPPLRA